MAAVARALSARGITTTIFSGGFPVSGINYGDAELVQLSPVRSPNAEYTTLVDEWGDEATDLLYSCRLGQLLNFTEARRPDVFVTELFPFGRRRFRYELMPVLERLRATRPDVPVLCSVRDILEPPSKPEKASGAMNRISEFYDYILVHGDAEYARLEDSFPISSEAAAKVRYSGFIGGDRSGDALENSTRNREVVVSAGGGAVGLSLYEAALGAASLCSQPDLIWRLLIGQNVPEEAFDALKGKSGDRIIVKRTRPDFPDLLRAARLSISQAGYNTVCDILAAGCASVLVPFSADGEREQTLRAMSLANRRRARVLHANDLSAASLAACVNSALEAAPNAFTPMQMTGADRAADLIARLARGEAV